MQADNHNRVARFDIEVKIEKDKNEDDLDDVLGDVDPQIKVQQNRNKNDSNISSNNSNSNNNNADVTCLPRTFEVEYEHGYILQNNGKMKAYKGEVVVVFDVGFFRDQKNVNKVHTSMYQSVELNKSAALPLKYYRLRNDVHDLK